MARKTSTTKKETCSKPRCKEAPAKRVKCPECSKVGLTTAYCSKKCLTEDKPKHEAWCSKKAYSFTIVLPETGNPTVLREVTIPSWYSFRQLHCVIQWGFGWENNHLHVFTIPRPCPPSEFDGEEVEFDIEPEEDDLTLDFDRKPALTIGPLSIVEFSSAEEKPISEFDAKLEDVYEEDGKYADKMPRHEKYGLPPPVRYMYDMGDSWEHLIYYNDTTLATSEHPVFTKIDGRGPLDDFGGSDGWHNIKSIFRKKEHNLTKEDREMKKMALKKFRKAGEEFPGSNVSAEDPFKKPPLTLLNNVTMWKEVLEFIHGTE